MAMMLYYLYTKNVVVINDGKYNTLSGAPFIKS